MTCSITGCLISQFHFLVEHLFRILVDRTFYSGFYSLVEYCCQEVFLKVLNKYDTGRIQLKLSLWFGCDLDKSDPCAIYCVQTTEYYIGFVSKLDICCLKRHMVSLGGFSQAVHKVA